MLSTEISLGIDKKIKVSATDTYKVCAFHVKMTLSVAKLERITYDRIEYDSSIIYS